MNIRFLQRIHQIFRQHVGPENPITARELEDELDLDHLNGSTNGRELVLEFMRQREVPIGASSNGYFLIATHRQLDRYRKRLDQRIAGIESRRDLVTETFRKYMRRKGTTGQQEMFG